MDNIESGAQRAAAFLEALRKRARAGEGLVESGAARVAEDPALCDHIKAMDAYLQACGESHQAMRQKSGVSPQDRQRLDDLWQAARTGDAFDRVADWHAQAGASGDRLDIEWLEAAFPGHGAATQQWLATTGRLGIVALRPAPGDGGDGGGAPRPAPAPAPIPSPHSPPPLHLCTVAPYETAFPDSATSGLAALSTHPRASVGDGHVSVISSTLAPVLSGGGTDSRALVGSKVTWPAGYARLTVTATVRLDGARLESLTTLGGATASAELLMTAALSNGGQFSAVTPIGAAVAPLLWHTELDAPGRYLVKITGIALNGLAGEALVAAGIHDNTAGVGVVGSSLAETFISGQVESICLDLS
jgi:hypothetical protein